MPTGTELVYLRLFEDQTIAVDIPREIASAKEAQDWTEWQLPMLGCNSLYSITEAGKKACRSRRQLDGRSASVLFVNDDFEPVDEAEATTARVNFLDPHWDSTKSRSRFKERRQ